MTLSKGQRFRVLERDGFTCRYCGRSSPEVELHVDHVQPASKGGKDGADNLVAACTDCNLGKSDRPLMAGAPALKPKAATPVVVPTLPCLDSCSACFDAREFDGLRLVTATREEPATDGYFAFYRCHRGHEWRTYWSKNWRATAEEIRREQMYDAIRFSYAEEVCG